MKRAVILLVATLAAASCSGDDSADPTTTPPAPTASAVATTGSTTVAPTTTDSPTTAPTTSSPQTSTSSAPGSSTTTAPSGDLDWRMIVETLGQRRQDLYASADVARIPDVCGPETPCFDELNAQIGDLANKGWHVEGADPFVVVAADVENFEGDSIDTAVVVTVVAVIKRPENSGRIVDTSGATVSEIEAATPPGFNARARFILGRGGQPGDEWRIVTQEELSEVPE